MIVREVSRATQAFNGDQRGPRGGVFPRFNLTLEFCHGGRTKIEIAERSRLGVPRDRRPFLRLAHPDVQPFPVVDFPRAPVPRDPEPHFVLIVLCFVVGQGVDHARAGIVRDWNDRHHPHVGIEPVGSATPGHPHLQVAAVTQ